MPDLRSAGVNSFDMSLFKNTRIWEKAQLQFRAEAFDAAQSRAVRCPNTAFGSSVFGVVSSQQNSPRNLQLGLRLLF